MKLSKDISTVKLEIDLPVLLSIFQLLVENERKDYVRRFLIQLRNEVFGIVMALLYIKTRTLLVPMVAHAINNAVAVAMQFLSTNSSTQQTNTPTSYLWVGLVCVALSAPFLIRFISRKWPNQRVDLPYFANVL